MSYSGNATYETVLLISLALVVLTFADSFFGPALMATSPQSAGDLGPSRPADLSDVGRQRAGARVPDP
jgi:hypothetical protein